MLTKVHAPVLAALCFVAVAVPGPLPPKTRGAARRFAQHARTTAPITGLPDTNRHSFSD